MMIVVLFATVAQMVQGLLKDDIKLAGAFIKPTIHKVFTTLGLLKVSCLVAGIAHTLDQYSKVYIRSY